MSTHSYNVQPLLDRITAMYAVEKVVSFLLPELKADDQNIRVRHGLMLEAEENKRQCERLEALIELLRPLNEDCDDQEKITLCYEQVSNMLRRFTLKHVNFGYDTSILVAQVTGRMDIVDTLQSCLMKEDVEHLSRVRH